jgi:hypothetical protein
VEILPLPPSLSDPPLSDLAELAFHLQTAVYLSFFGFFALNGLLSVFVGSSVTSWLHRFVSVSDIYEYIY